MPSLSGFPSAFLLSCAMVIMGFAACSHRTTLPDPQQAGWEGKSVCEVVQENDKLRVLRCTFPPGVGHERHFHAPHIGYIIAGSTFRIEDASGVREVNVPTGSSFDNAYIPWHQVLNIGDSTAVFLIIEMKD
jgi:beta-alanine degradation protein BauB